MWRQMRLTFNFSHVLAFLVPFIELLLLGRSLELFDNEFKINSADGLGISGYPLL